MKTQLHITTVTLVVCFFTFPVVNAQNTKHNENSEAYKNWKKNKEQEYNAWSNQKAADYTVWVQQKEEEYQQYLKDHTNWNKIVLGKNVKPAVIELSEKEAGEASIKRPTPYYVSEEIALKTELKQLKATIKHFGKELAVKELIKEPAVVEPYSEINVKIEPPKQTTPVPNKVKTHTKTARNFAESTEQQSEAEIKESLYEKEVNAIPSIAPVQGKYRISSSFGYRTHPIYKRIIHHDGIDLACPKGTPVLAPANGIVEQAGWVQGYGNFIKIRHGNGYVTVYGHLLSIQVRKGDRIDKRYIIGKVGSTGNSTGNHLHYEVIKNGKKINPQRHLG
jgi:murein DD-endopeptidase MepM/ murein hydrolase activator NlpD